MTINNSSFCREYTVEWLDVPGGPTVEINNPVVVLADELLKKFHNILKPYAMTRGTLRLTIEISNDPKFHENPIEYLREFKNKHERMKTFDNHCVQVHRIFGQVLEQLKIQDKRQDQKQDKKPTQSVDKIQHAPLSDVFHGEKGQNGQTGSIGSIGEVGKNFYNQKRKIEKLDDTNDNNSKKYSMNNDQDESINNSNSLKKQKTSDEISPILTDELVRKFLLTAYCRYPNSIGVLNLVKYIASNKEFQKNPVIYLQEFKEKHTRDKTFDDTCLYGCSIIEATLRDIGII